MREILGIMLRRALARIGVAVSTAHILANHGAGSVIANATCS